MNVQVERSAEPLDERHAPGPRIVRAGPRILAPMRRADLRCQAKTALVKVSRRRDATLLSRAARNLRAGIGERPD